MAPVMLDFSHSTVFPLLFRNYLKFANVGMDWVKHQNATKTTPSTSHKRPSSTVSEESFEVTSHQPRHFTYYDQYGMNDEFPKGLRRTRTVFVIFLLLFKVFFDTTKFVLVFSTSFSHVKSVVV